VRLCLLFCFSVRVLCSLLPSCTDAPSSRLLDAVTDWRWPPALGNVLSAELSTDVLLLVVIFVRRSIQRDAVAGAAVCVAARESGSTLFCLAAATSSTHRLACCTPARVSFSALSTAIVLLDIGS
jgi:hypothetical protein